MTQQYPRPSFCDERRVPVAAPTDEEKETVGEENKDV